MNRIKNERWKRKGMNLQKCHSITSFEFIIGFRIQGSILCGVTLLFRLTGVVTDCFQIDDYDAVTLKFESRADDKSKGWSLHTRVNFI